MTPEPALQKGTPEASVLTVRARLGSIVQTQLVMVVFTPVIAILFNPSKQPTTPPAA